MKLLALLLTSLMVISCATDTPSSGDIKGAKPTPTEKPDVDGVSDAVNDARDGVKDIVEKSKDLKKNNEKQKEQIRTLSGTVNYLQDLLVDQTKSAEQKLTAAAATIKRLQEQVVAIMVTRDEQELKIEELTLRGEESDRALERSQKEVIELRAANEAADNEKIRLREGWEATIKAVELNEKVRKKAEKKAEEAREHTEYYNGRYWRNTKIIAVTAIATLLLYFLYRFLRKLQLGV